MIDELARHRTFLLKQRRYLDSFSPKCFIRATERKEACLRIVASIFDPLELVSLIFITGKELLQTLWSRGYQWDDVIEEKRPPLVSAWLDQLISQVKVPR